MIVIAERPVNFIPEGGWKKGRRARRALAVSLGLDVGPPEGKPGSGTQFSGVRKSPFRRSRARWCVLVVGGRLGGIPARKRTGGSLKCRTASTCRPT
jgi:hypothetical protein